MLYNVFWLIFYHSPCHVLLSVRSQPVNYQIRMFCRLPANEQEFERNLLRLVTGRWVVERWGGNWCFAWLAKLSVCGLECICNRFLTYLENKSFSASLSKTWPHKPAKLTEPRTTSANASRSGRTFLHLGLPPRSDVGYAEPTDLAVNVSTRTLSSHVRQIYWVREHRRPQAVKK